jgi:hypothetical protein
MCANQHPQLTEPAVINSMIDHVTRVLTQLKQPPLQKLAISALREVLGGWNSFKTHVKVRCLVMLSYFVPVAARNFEILYELLLSLLSNLLPLQASAQVLMQLPTNQHILLAPLITLWTSLVKAVEITQVHIMSALLGLLERFLTSHCLVLFDDLQIVTAFVALLQAFVQFDAELSGGQNSGFQHRTLIYLGRFFSSRSVFETLDGVEHAVQAKRTVHDDRFFTLLLTLLQTVNLPEVFPEGKFTPVLTAYVDRLWDTMNIMLQMHANPVVDYKLDRVTQRKKSHLACVLAQFLLRLVLLPPQQAPWVFQKQMGGQSWTLQHVFNRVHVPYLHYVNTLDSTVNQTHTRLVYLACKSIISTAQNSLKLTPQQQSLTRSVQTLLQTLLRQG